jgi:2,4-dienoyl-CoA reductase-like NADH-dependent reductase (Old Yellow Enzyme family)
MKNRFMLAPMTNQQSGEDGTLSDAELHWLELRARGGFGYIVTCASHVLEGGKGFPGELGIFGEQHVPGLAAIAAALHSFDCRCSVQLYHGGMRSITSDRVSPSGDTKTGSRALSLDEIEAHIEAFAAAAVRAEQAGFDGVELHAAHGYLIAQFLSPIYNKRTDEFGGSPEKRSRFLFRIIDAIRARVGPQFQVGVRLSPERFGQDLGQIVAVVNRLFIEGKVDFVDMSLWDVFKQPEDKRYGSAPLMSHFTSLDRRATRLGFAGRIISPQSAARCLAEGADFVSLGKVAVIHHNYPQLLAANPEFVPDWLPYLPTGCDGKV